MITLEQFAPIFKGLKSAYPNSRALETIEAYKMWHRMLQDLDPEQLNLAIVKHISTSKFPPTIAEIREAALLTTQKDWSEGWALVLQAISLYGIYQVEKAYDYIQSRDELAYKVTKRLGFQNICVSEDLTIDRANFRMAYISSEKLETEKAQLPADVKVAMEKLLDAKRLSTEQAKLEGAK